MRIFLASIKVMHQKLSTNPINTNHNFHEEKFQDIVQQTIVK